MTTRAMFIENRKLYIPHEDLEDLIIGYLEDNGYTAENEIILGVDLGLEVDSKGLTTVDIDLTWED